MGGSRGRGRRLPQIPGPGRNTAYMVCYVASLTQQGCDRPVTRPAGKICATVATVATGCGSCHYILMSPNNGKMDSLAPFGIAECRLYVLSLPVYSHPLPRRARVGGLVEKLVRQSGR